MTYLKVGDGVFVNGEINPYNLGGWPFPVLDPAVAQRERDRNFMAEILSRSIHVPAGDTLTGFNPKRESAADLVNRVAAEQREGKA